MRRKMSNRACPSSAVLALAFTLAGAPATTGAEPPVVAASRNELPPTSRLLDWGRAADVVSPNGVASTVCNVIPLTSAKASHQLVSATDIDCSALRKYAPTAMWLPQSSLTGVGPTALNLVRRHAMVYQGAPPFNAEIERWIVAHNAPRVSPGLPVRFAVVSVLTYARAWDYPVPKSLSRVGVFKGRTRRSHAVFIRGRGAVLQRDQRCERMSVPLEFGGTLRLSVVSRQRYEDALRCLNHGYPGTVKQATFVMPRIRLRGRADVTRTLKELGATDVFDRSREPFPLLQPGLALDAVLQATDLRIDEQGVGVRATVAAMSYLGLPRPELTVVYDRPFAFEVLDGDRAVLALGVVNDL